MLLIDKIDQPARPRHRPTVRLSLPKTRPSILDPQLESEPWIDPCPCVETFVLFLHNRPIVLIDATSLDAVSLNTRLFELRHRYQRKVRRAKVKPAR